MRIFVLFLAVAIFLLGTGAAYLGLNVAYRAIDPEAYRDSKPSTYLLFGGLFMTVGLVLLAAAVGLMLQALEYVLPRWPAALVAALGLLPYPALMGPPSIAINLLLLGIAALLLWARQFGERARSRGPGDMSPLE